MNMRSKGLGISLLLLLCIIYACDGAENSTGMSVPPPAPAAGIGADAAAAVIDGATLRDFDARISSDQFEGRGPGSRGDVAARKYIAGQLAALGYQPGAADGGWEQPISLVGTSAHVPDSWGFHASGRTLALKNWDQYIATSGVQSDSAQIKDAEVVFVGYGIQAPEFDWDDFKGQDLKGKVLLIMNNDPDWDPALFAGKTRLHYGRWDYKYESAARQGAAGAIIIHTRESAGYPFQVIQTSNTGEVFELPAEGEPRLQVAAWMTEDAVRQLVAMAGRDLDKLVAAAHERGFQPVHLGITTSFAFTNTVSQVKTANVLGLLPGSDPGLRDEVVVYTAHHDHFGIGKPDKSGDNIYNGALDNGAGVATLLAIAKACKALATPPKRSILFAFVAAEEQGLLGSKYYARHPTFVPGRIVANINYDSGNKWGRTRDVTFVGYGKSSIDRIVDGYASKQGRVVKPDQFPDRGYFYRSDQYNFAKIGVPAMYLKTGTDFIGRPPGWGRQQVEYYEDHDYHQPSDELTDDWNFDGMVQDARLGFLTGMAIANADKKPSWNPGDEFANARSNVYKRQILEAEVAFARLVKQQGMKAGFLAYAADDAVLNRNNRLIKGRQAMAAYFDNMKYRDIRLEWYPDFIQVSSSGDLGYTYGHYTFTARDEAGKAVQAAGIFHTVWQRQADGNWRFVWD